MSISDSVRAHSSMNGAGPHPPRLMLRRLRDSAWAHGCVRAAWRLALPSGPRGPTPTAVPAPASLSCGLTPRSAAGLRSTSSLRPAAASERPRALLGAPFVGRLRPGSLRSRWSRAWRQFLALEKVLLAGTKGQETGEFWLGAVEDRYLTLERFHDAARGGDECHSRGHVPFMLGDQRPRRIS